MKEERQLRNESETKKNGKIKFSIVRDRCKNIIEFQKRRRGNIDEVNGDNEAGKRIIMKENNRENTE